MLNGRFPKREPARHITQGTGVREHAGTVRKGGKGKEEKDRDLESKKRGYPST